MIGYCLCESSEEKEVSLGRFGDREAPRGGLKDKAFSTNGTREGAKTSQADAPACATPDSGRELKAVRVGVRNEAGARRAWSTRALSSC